MGADSSGVLMSFSQTLKLIARFRFINVFFGDLLETFLSTAGQGLDPKSILDRDSIIQNTVASRGKFAKYETPITTLDIYHYKTALYMFSFIVRLIEKIFIDIIRTSRIKKFGFYFIFYHNRIHFLLFNMFLAGGIFLNTRTLLHMKAWPDNLFMRIDKIIGIFVFLFYWSDIIELYNSSLTPPPNKKKDLTKIKIRNGYKKVLEKYKE